MGCRITLEEMAFSVAGVYQQRACDNGEKKPRQKALEFLQQAPGS